MQVRGRRGKNTAVAQNLPWELNRIRSIGAWNHVCESAAEIIERRRESAEVHAIVVDRWRRRLAGDLLEVVAKTCVRSPVVIVNQLTFFQQLTVKVSCRR